VLRQSPKLRQTELNTVYTLGQPYHPLGHQFQCGYAAEFLIRFQNRCYRSERTRLMGNRLIMSSPGLVNRSNCPLTSTPSYAGLRRRVC
jgi:hypothetical protein